MRFPFPERIPVYAVAIFAVLLFAVQRAEGTSLYFSTGCFLFLLIAALAFNTAGGLTRSSGAYIFFYSVLVVIIGVSYKAFLGEPADRNLTDPRTTIEVYVGGISMMAVAAFVSRRVSRRTGLLESVLKDSQMFRASIGCMIFGTFASSAIALLGPQGVRIQSAFTQINYLVPVGIIIGVIHEIRSSGGKRSVNPFVLAGAAYYFIIFGILGFSKQGMLTPILCWFIAAGSQHYRFSRMQLAGGLLAALIIFRYLTPFAQYARGLQTPDSTPREKMELAIQLLSHPEQTREEYMRQSEDARGLNSYYDTPQGFWERLQFISVDDALINVTDQGRVFGLLPLQAEMLNAIPHVFWPEKPSFNFGNVYAHEIGGMADEDTSTGISFSPTAEAYHLAEWKGVLLIAPLLWFIFFVVYDSLFGDLRSAPWGLLAAVDIAHAAPENGVTGVIHLLTFGTEGLVFCAVFAAWFAPAVASIILGPGRERTALRAAA